MASPPPEPTHVHGVLDFRAPPPSPIAASRRASSVANDEVLTDFLHQSLRVPDLVLPDRLFPRLEAVDADKVVPTVDFRSLVGASKVARDALETTGCFQLVNHGVSGDLLRASMAVAAGVFQLPTERKKAVERSGELGFGFEEVVCDDDEDDVDLCEEFVWCDHYGLKNKMQEIWPHGYSNFSEKMEKVSLAIEEVSRKIIETLNMVEERNSIATQGQGLDGSSSSVCYIYKHPNGIPVERYMSSFRYDVIRMMIRGSDYPHALSLHVCEEGCSEFHVYSKKGWVSFTPTPNALVVTSGDQIQAWSGGQHKHVIGRPIYTSEQQGNSISMAFLCSPSTFTSKNKPEEEEDQRTITLQQQALFAVLFTFAFQLLLFLYQSL